MKRLFLTAGFAALLALSAPAEAEPMSRGPDHRPPDEVWPGDASERWFFGDGGFGCPLWWCGDAGLARRKGRAQADAQRALVLRRRRLRLSVVAVRRSTR